MRPAAGTVLVASPQLTDPNFVRTVVFLVEHSAGGTLGFIVNRPLPTPLGEIWSDAPAGLVAALVAAEGGPVEPSEGLLLHGCPTLSGAQEMSPGCAIGGDLDAIAQRYQGGADSSGPRLFLGHSGWTGGQLEREIAEGAWLVRPASIELLLDNQPPAQLWRRLSEGPRGGGEPSLN
jgi:putative transcriptional regulator